MHVKEKKERSLGIRLFLKANRCNSPKCALAKKPYPPGIFGKKRKRGLSEMGTELKEKQRVKFSYSLSEAQLKRIFKSALRSPEATNELMVQLLERRLDNVVYRLGFANSRPNAHQLISHGHILTNGKKTTASSYVVRVGDVISWRDESKKSGPYKAAEINVSKVEAPEWLKLDTKQVRGEVVALPLKLDLPFNMNLLVEYYSK